MKASSYNLVMSAMFNGRKGERLPVGNPTSIVCHGLMDAAGVSFPEAHLDAGAMAELALAGHEVLGFDTVMPEFSVQQEGAALGCEVDWGNRDRMPEMENVIKRLHDRGIREKVKVMVGGAPLDTDFAEKIGADAYGEDAAEAVAIARSLIDLR
jgi:uroporphyrinogen-III decarboxylase